MIGWILRPMQKNLRLLPLFLALPLFACRDDPEAALRVGEIGFLAEQVSALSPEQLHTLADLTAFLQAVAGSTTSTSTTTKLSGTTAPMFAVGHMPHQLRI